MWNIIEIKNYIISINEIVACNNSSCDVDNKKKKREEKKQIYLNFNLKSLGKTYRYT